MFDPKEFYKTYQYDYYLYKSMTFKSILDNIDKFQTDIIQGSVIDFIREDYERMLKSEIRQTFYQSIETVFELIFALTPDDINQSTDLEILSNLTNSDWRKNYIKIAKIAENEMGLNFLDKNIKVNNFTIPISQYVFYYGILPNNSLMTEENIILMNHSIDAIKYGLKILAREFVERNEYNSYKHALRIIPILENFSIHEGDSLDKIVEWDLSDSMTYMNNKKNQDDNTEVEFITLLFDTNRDIGLTLFCANLISNIILLRRAGFRLSGKETKIPVLFWGKENLKEVSKMGVPIQNIRFKIEKITQKK